MKDRTTKGSLALGAWMAANGVTQVKLCVALQAILKKDPPLNQTTVGHWVNGESVPKSALETNAIEAITGIPATYWCVRPDQDSGTLPSTDVAEDPTGTDS